MEQKVRRGRPRSWVSRECVVAGCVEGTKQSGSARGYCVRHYQQMRRHGEVRDGKVAVKEKGVE